eukprot:TRINITY_DN102254_c0_g1_i1.p1 TRINITY_DN102254_c0_g1~~TRINITY_DN102254_c0_g1_i1.p1  ORF type:complete len:280 (+),score=85.16 TRINITY_DN102254_c0_g1_i1:78-917(+)
MSEMRQRRGFKDEAVASSAPAPGTAEHGEALQEFLAMMQKESEAPKPGLSHEAKKWKNALQSDPFNMEFITRLGVAYAQDRQWQRSVTVMLRGWKRVSDFPQRKAAFEYLCLLSQGSFKLDKYKQALAVLQDVTEDMLAEVDCADKSRFHALRCQVYCANNEQQKALKAFHQAIEGQAFETAAGHWAGCLAELKKVELLDVTRSALQAKAGSDEERQKLEAMEAIALAKEAYREQEAQPKLPDSLRIGVRVIQTLLVLIALYGLYVLEQRSFARIKSDR